MQGNIDLYALLRSYAYKSRSPVIDLEVFIKFLERSIGRGNTTNVSFEEWKEDTYGKVTNGINELVAANKITLHTDSGISKIGIPNFYVDIIENTYLSMDESGKTPFPDEKTIDIKIAPEKIRSIKVEIEMVDFLGEKHNSPNQIIKLVFPEGYRTALSVESMYPRKMLELSLIKIQEPFHHRGEMEYFTQKMVSRFNEQQARVKEFINILLTRPTECLANIEESSELTYTMWAFFCPLICTYVDERARYNEVLPEYTAIVQAATLVSAYNRFFQTQCIERRQKEFAFNALDTKLSEPPYVFTVADMINFKSSTGAPILQQYTPADLDEFLKKNTSSAEVDKLPPLLTFRGRGGIDWYTKKDKVITLCTKLLVEARNQIKNEVESRWKKMLFAYKQESAMEKDSDFEDLLFRTAKANTPLLLAIIRDKKTAFLQAEMALQKNALPRNESFFDGERPLPLRIILILRRDEILRLAKLDLPFWYSIKPIVALIRFFKVAKKDRKTNPATVGSSGTKQDENKQKLIESASKLFKAMAPEGSVIDEYLDKLNDRWNQLIAPKEQKIQRDDVNALIRNYVQQVYKIQGASSLTMTMLDDIAESLVRHTPALTKINNKNALRLYIKIYITKILGGGKSPT
ncbi:MAG: hypothetical protein LBT01_07955 [Spirochaetaceae bacterium]|jgi:hypothetical protein|nr:hypothetical protein [Spirochaetaceae bacterium]